MRDQYVGDVTDVLKYALLRTLVGDDLTLGVAWYYVPKNDGRPDGRHREWREQEGWKSLDAEVYDALSSDELRTVEAVMAAPFWPRGTVFDSTAVPQSNGRKSWADTVVAKLSGQRVVFLDPDTGVGEPSERHVSLTELAAFHATGATVVFISFPERRRHDLLVEELHQLVLRQTKCATVATLRTTVRVPYGIPLTGWVPRARWFTIVEPGEVLSERLKAFNDKLGTVPYVRAQLCEGG